MKKYVWFIFILGVMAFGSISAYAQCTPSMGSTIQCSYYNQAYRDGANDAQSNRSNNYRRYRNKYTRRYESFYRDGYNAGFDSGQSGTRWTASQRRAYDSGYTIGQNERRRGGDQNRSSGNYGGYDQTIGLYFQQGYSDGYDNRPRQYDVQVGGYIPATYPPNPGSGGGNSGSASWSGRVDDRANIIIRGNSIRSEDVSLTGLQVYTENIKGSLGRRSGNVTVRKESGRGTATVIQQPSRNNDFTAIVQIVDTRGGADNYRVEIAWGSSGGGGGNIYDPYRSGSVRWRGRVDQTANIVISGGDIESEDASGTGLSNVSFDINGVLVRRSGSVTAHKRNGRGTVRVLQQPSRNNDFTAIVQIFDPGSGADNYEVDISW